jgi:hypothetical protein
MFRSSVYVFILFFLIKTGNLFAQTGPRCSTDEYIQLQIQKDPGYLERIQQALQSARDTYANEAAGTRSTYVIPVVVHVVYNTPTENISDEQILSQIDVLNEDYNRLNADASKTPEGFLPVAGSMPVQFCLAAYDPDGNPTSGITRTQTTITDFGLDDKMKSSATGGADPWPAKHYLNIWTCDLSDNVLGYATLPYDFPPPDNDGVVIRYNVFGRTGVLSPSYNRGRTCTHEVGHWLGLFHTFEGGCTDGDHCDDTPKEKEPVYNCPPFPNISCNNGPDGDMYMNYMDYTNDVCMNLFTVCQCSIMTATLEDPSLRASLKNSPGGCQGVAFDLDASTDLVIFPIDTLPQQGFEPRIQVSNKGAETIFSLNISYRVDGQPESTFTYTEPIGSLQIKQIDLPPYFTGEGGHVFYAWTSLPNGLQDEFVFNDTASGAFMVISEVPKNTNTIDSSLTDGPFVFNIQNPAAGTMHVQIVNVLGQIVYEGTAEVVKNPNLIIDVPDLTPGLYFLYGKIGYDYVKQKIMVVR